MSNCVGSCQFRNEEEEGEVNEKIQEEMGAPPGHRRMNTR